MVKEFVGWVFGGFCWLKGEQQLVNITSWWIISWWIYIGGYWFVFWFVLGWF